MIAAAGCGASGDDGAGSATSGTTLTVRATQSGFQKIFRSRKGFEPGDAFIVSSDLAGGGHKEAYCVISDRPRTDWCAITLVLPRGQISAQGVFVDAPELSGALPLLSGTGAYAGASGSLTTDGVIGRRESIRIHLR
ncbi:MAG: hypothetical protein QOJ89_2734 [bacterium]|jgi:hypothetical protein